MGVRPAGARAIELTSGRGGRGHGGSSGGRGRPPSNSPKPTPSSQPGAGDRLPIHLTGPGCKVRGWDPGPKEHRSQGRSHRLN